MNTALPLDLRKLQAKFERWRKTRKARTPIPQPLLQTAAGFLDRYTTSRVCRVCRLHPSVFKKLDSPMPKSAKPIVKPEGGASAISRVKADASFYPLPPLLSLPDPTALAPQAARDCQVLLERPDGARLTIVLPGIDAASISALCVNFLRSSTR